MNKASGVAAPNDKNLPEMKKLASAGIKAPKHVAKTQSTIPEIVPPNSSKSSKATVSRKPFNPTSSRFTLFKKPTLKDQDLA
mmetsp:Transcript_25070/g.38905  ORF Transcript_25070/g.38905 Transcript_25070/m.38905 type:complete len:82 (+) Transcript_25070:1809-2054(+)